MASDVKSLTDFKSVDQLKKELALLKRENQAALKTIDKLLKDISKKNDEIEHLKSMLTQTVPVIKSETSIVRLDITAEEEIAEIQLNKLRQTSKERALTLEETRIYDLLVKNKRLSQEQSTINLTNKDYKNLSTETLAEIAGNIVDVEIESDK